jgi:hypothetical protein
MPAQLMSAQKDVFCRKRSDRVEVLGKNGGSFGRNGRELFRIFASNKWNGPVQYVENGTVRSHS